jgi:hypothetical protein
MRSKILIAASLLLAFVVGTMASGLTSNAFNKPEEQTVISAQTARAATPVVYRTRYVEPRAVAGPAATPRAVETTKKRSWQKEALIIGGSAGAGAAVGAVAGGKKGAAIGAVSGGVAGLVYDLMTRNKNK